MPLPADVQNLINEQLNKPNITLEWEVFGNASDEARFVLTFRKKTATKDPDERWLLRKSYATTFESAKEKANREKLERKQDKIERKAEKNEVSGRKEGERLSLRERLKERTEKKFGVEKKVDKGEQKEKNDNKIENKIEKNDKRSEKIEQKTNAAKSDGLVQRHEEKMAKKMSLDESAINRIPKDEPKMRPNSKITSAPSSRRNSTTSLDYREEGGPLVRRNSSRSSRRTPFRKLKKNEKLYKEGKLQFSLSVENLSELPELSEDSMTYGLSSIVNKKSFRSGDKAKNGENEEEEEALQSVSSRIADWQRASLKGSKYGGGNRGENFPRTKKSAQRAMSMDCDIRPRAKTWGNEKQESFDGGKENGDFRWRLKSSKEKRNMFSEARNNSSSHGNSSSASSDKPSWATASFLRSGGVYRV